MRRWRTSGPARSWPRRRPPARPGRRGPRWRPQARPRPQPGPEGTPAVLRDGSEVLIRQVRGSDAPLLADGFARLSARSRQQRFLSPKNTLSAAELRFLTEVDHYDHEAIGALSPADGRGVGIARYIRDPGDPRRPRSPSPSPTTGRAAAWAPSCWPGCPIVPARRASAASPRRSAYGNAAMAGLLQNMGAELAGYGPRHGGLRGRPGSRRGVQPGLVVPLRG